MGNKSSDPVDQLPTVTASGTYDSADISHLFMLFSHVRLSPSFFTASKSHKKETFSEARNITLRCHAMTD